MNNGGDVLNSLLGVRNKDFFFYDTVVIALYHYEVENSVTLHKRLHNHLMTMLEAMPEKNIKDSCFTIIHEIHPFIH